MTGNFPSYFHKRNIGLRSVLSPQCSDDVFIRNLTSTQRDELQTFDSEIDRPTYALKYSPVPNFQQWIGMANEDGDFGMQQGCSGQLYSLNLHRNAIFDFAFNPEEVLEVVTVSGDQTAVLWDTSMLGCDQASRLNTFKYHTHSVKVVQFRPGTLGQFATGSRDCDIVLWDPRLSSSSQVADVIRTQGHVTGMAFQDENTLISCSDNGGIIKVWDLRYSKKTKSQPRPLCQLQHPGQTANNGFTCLTIDPLRPYLYASCMDDHIYRYNLASYASKPDSSFTGYSNDSFFIRISLSADGEYLASGSSEGRAYIWNTRHLGMDLNPVAYLEGHQPDTEVTCVDWNHEEKKLLTCGDDYRHFIWRLGAQLPKGEDEPREINPRSVVMTGMYPSRPNGPNGAEVVRRQREEALIRTPPSRPLDLAVITPKTLTPASSKTSILRFLSPATTPPTSGERRRGAKRPSDENQTAKGEPLLGAASRIPLSPIKENVHVTPTSRPPPKSGGSGLAARNITGLLDCPSPKKPRLDDFPCSPRKTVCSPRKSSSATCSPMPSPRKLLTPKPSPRKLVISPRKKAITESPTVNLPNLVCDGRSPIHVSVTRSGRKMDWLTTLSQQRKKTPKAETTPKAEGKRTPKAEGKRTPNRGRRAVKKL